MGKTSMILPNININSNGVIEENKAFIQIKLTSILEEWDRRVSEEEKNEVAYDKREYIVPAIID